MMKKKRILALLLVFLLLLFPLTAYAEEDGEEQETRPEDWKPYSFLCEEGERQASLHMHPVYAERGNVDLLDAFIEAADAGVSLYVGIGDVKLHLSSKLVSDVARRGEPVLLLIEELTGEDAPSSSEPTETEEDEPPADVLYRFDLGFSFDVRSIRISLKHTTSNADGLHVIASNEAGEETVLTSAYGDSLVSFFPEERTFTVRITEEPLPEKASPVPFFLAAFLLLLVVGSVVLTVLIGTGTLKRIYLSRFGG